MCERCEKLQKMAETMLEITKQMHEDAHKPLHPATVGACLSEICGALYDRAMQMMVQKAVSNIVSQLGLPAEATSEEIADELIKRKNDGTLPEGLKIAVLTAEELTKAMKAATDIAEEEVIPHGNKDFLN